MSSIKQLTGEILASVKELLDRHIFTCPGLAFVVYPEAL
jgi:hypothetical protein